MIIHAHVGTHGPCVHFNNHVHSLTIYLKRTHEPCVPTSLSRSYSCAKQLMQQTTCTHVGTHSPCVHPNNHMHSLTIYLKRTHEPCVPTSPSHSYSCTKQPMQQTTCTHVGTHGSCVHSNNHVHSLTILLERTHEPCVPTSSSHSYPCAKQPMQQTTCTHVGTHGPCVHSNNHVHSLIIHLKRTHEPCVPTSPSHSYSCAKQLT